MNNGDKNNLFNSKLQRYRKTMCNFLYLKKMDTNGKILQGQYYS